MVDQTTNETYAEDQSRTANQEDLNKTAEQARKKAQERARQKESMDEQAYADMTAEQEEKARAKEQQAQQQAEHQAMMVAMYQKLNLEPTEQTMAMFASVAPHGKSMVLTLADKSGVIIDNGKKVSFQGDQFTDFAAKGLAAQLLARNPQTIKLGGTPTQKNMIVANFIALESLPKLEQELATKITEIESKFGDGELTTEQQDQIQQEIGQLVHDSVDDLISSYDGRVKNTDMSLYNIKKDKNHQFIKTSLMGKLNLKRAPHAPEGPSAEANNDTGPTNNGPDAPTPPDAGPTGDTPEPLGLEYRAPDIAPAPEGAARIGYQAPKVEPAPEGVARIGYEDPDAPKNEAPKERPKKARGNPQRDFANENQQAHMGTLAKILSEMDDFVNDAKVTREQLTASGANEPRMRLKLFMDTSKKLEERISAEKQLSTAQKDKYWDRLANQQKIVANSIKNHNPEDRIANDRLQQIAEDARKYMESIGEQIDEKINLKPNTKAPKPTASQPTQPTNTAGPKPPKQSNGL